MTWMERYGAGRIHVAEYDPAWPLLFDSEAMRVREALGTAVIAVEHVGSTAIPGLAAKPIIDLVAGVRSLADIGPQSIERLQSLGYVYLAHYAAWLPEEMLFRKGMPGPWTHHLHVTEPSSPRWEELVSIRDYLRCHPDVASAYADLKRGLALVFEDDIAGYREAKRPFLQQILRKARSQREALGQEE